MEKSLVNHCHKQNTIGCDENIDFVDTEEHMKTVIIGIAGGTGSGKSSVVNLIPRFYDATRGEVLVDGKNVRDYTLEELRAKVGVVLQKAVLFKGTIRENLSWGNSDATDEEMYEALETAQAREFVDAKEGGLSYEIEQGGRNLSGGHCAFFRRYAAADHCPFLH